MAGKTKGEWRIVKAKLVGEMGGRVTRSQKKNGAKVWLFEEQKKK